MNIDWVLQGMQSKADTLVFTNIQPTASLLQIKPLLLPCSFLYLWRLIDYFPLSKLLGDGYHVLPSFVCIFLSSSLRKAEYFIFFLQIMILKLLYFFLCPGICLIYLCLVYNSVTKTGLGTLAKAFWLLSEVQDFFMDLEGNVFAYTTWNGKCLLDGSIMLVKHV